MSAGTACAADEPTPQEMTVLLRRIAESLEPPTHSRWIEMIVAAVLALATTASAWCAYQSTLWGGVQTFQLATAGRAGREASQRSLAAFESRAFDAQVLIAYIELKSRGDEKLATFLHDRFRPEAKRAVDAWLQTDPFNNPNAPKRPFDMADYVQPELLEMKQFEAEASRMQEAAQHSNAASDGYVLLTVLFASVLFFGGIGGTFKANRLKAAAYAITIVLFVVTVCVMATMPICRE